MPETLTDAQKVLRNDTGIRMAAALETLASGVEPSTAIAPEYDATQTYAVGDLVIYRSVLYRCTTAITTPEEWTAAHWTATMVSDEYRPAAAQDLIDANLMALGLTGASVGDLVRVAAVDANGKPTSWRKAPLCEIKTNPNLLDNWYFVGGGGRQGGGQFPINQRGKTSYTNAEYGIDRWRTSASGNVTIKSDSVSVSVSGVTNFYQIVNPIPAGTKITISVLCKNTSVGMRFGLRNTSWGGMLVCDLQDGLSILSGTIPSDYTDKIYFAFWSHSGTPSVDIIAAKLELGSEQTLAHQENGQWVLNEIPDYGEELAKCQKYYIKINRSVLSGFSNSAGSYAYVSTGILMKSNPTITVQNTGSIIAKDGEQQISNIIVWTAPKPAVGLRIEFATASASHADSLICLADAVFTLSCDL